MSGSEAVRPRTSTRRRLAGVAAGLVALACVGLPVAWTGLLASIALSGCLLECGEPRVGTGLGWSAATAALLAVPVAVALAVAGVRSRPAWWWSVGLVVLVVAAGALLASAA